MNSCSRFSVEEHRNFRKFGYRAPRIGFPLSMAVELAHKGETRTVAVRGIDISSSGIAVAVTDEVALAESVELVIRHEAKVVARVPGRVFHQSEKHFGLEFQFESDEQRQPLQALIAQFLAKI